MNAPYKPRQKPRRTNADASEPAWSNECAPTFTLSRQVARARAEMGEQRWTDLNAEWN